MKAKIALLLALVAFFSTAAIADRFKHISHVVDAGDLAKLHLDISVAELDIEAYSGDEIQLEIDIEAQRSWFSFRSKDVEDIELDIEGSGSELYIRLDEKDIEQHWKIKLPETLELEIDLGVGEVLIEDFVSSLDIDVGVGSVQVELTSDDYGLIHANVGVGDSRIRGFGRGTDNERNFISADSYYSGEGEHSIEIELGVGEVDVRRR